MAERRMISRKILATNTFYALTDKAKVLYLVMIMNADDDGFVADVKGLMKHYNARMRHYHELLESELIISFPSGIVLITHWKVHNMIRSDRYKETDFMEEKSMVYVDEKDKYHLLDGCHLVDKMSPQVSSRKVKEKKGKVNEDVVRPLRGADLPPIFVEKTQISNPDDEKKFQCLHGKLGQGVVYLTDQQMDVLLEKLGLDGFNRYVERLADYIIKKDAHVNNHYETILRWATEDSAV